MTGSTPASLEDARAALDSVVDPDSGQGLVAAGLVQGLVVRDGRAGFMLEVPASRAAAYAPVREAAGYVTVLGGGQGAVREICDLLAGARQAVGRGVVA